MSKKERSEGQAKAKLSRIGHRIRNEIQTIPHRLSKGGFSFPPRRIGVQVNTICNMKCLMCDIGLRNASQEFYKVVENKKNLDFKIFKKLVDDVKTFRPVIAINLTEPLLKKDVVEFVDYVQKNKLECVLTTNGYLLENLAEDFVKANLSVINVSIDGTLKIHNRIRGINDSFERAHRGISLLSELKKRLGEDTPEIYVASVISNYNVGCLYETVKIFKELGVNGVKFTHLSFISETMAEAHNNKYRDIYEVKPSSLSAINPNEIDESALSQEVKRVREEFNSFVSFTPKISTIDEIRTYYKQSECFMSNTQCFIPWINAQILANGDVMPSGRCFHIIMGNINNDNFSKIWDGTRFRNFRKFLREVGTTPACSRCCGIL